MKIKPQDHPDIAGNWIWTDLEIRWIEDRIVEAIKAEREACAEVCDSIYYQNIGPAYGEVRHGIAQCAGAIRARGNNE